MKAQERRHLKQNEVVSATVRVVEAVAANRDRAMMIGIAVLAVALIGGGYMWWRTHTNESASALLGVALAVEQAPIAPAPTVPGAGQSPGTYPSELVRQEAALKAFRQVDSSYPHTSAGLTARYHVAVTLSTMGKWAEAEQAFQAVASEAGSSIYGPMARMGRAEAILYSGRFDDAIKAFTELSAERDSVLPLDGVLIQLARSCLKAGKPQDARAAFKRVVDEFAQSPYTQEAKQQLALLG
jgi:TolA-binding protein